MCLLSSCRDVCVSPDLTFVNSKAAFKDTTFRDELRECYRIDSIWAKRGEIWSRGQRFSSFFRLTSCWWDIERERRTRSCHWWWSSDRGWPEHLCPRSSRSGSSPRWFAWRWEMFYYYFYNWSGFHMLNNAMSTRSQESNLLDYFKLMRACVALLVNVCPALLDMSVTNHSNVHGCRR